MAFATVLFLFTQKTQGQAITLQNGKVEVGLGIGPSFFLGDLGGQRGIGQPFIKDINIPLTKLSKGIYLNLYPAEWIGFRVSLNHMVVEGDDAEIDNKGGREISRLRRNLYFKSNITEAYAALEFYPTVFLEQYDGLQGKLRPYGLIGIGAFHFNPKGYYIGGNGQFKYYVKESLYVGLEILHRKTFTDYVDDVSTSYIDPIYFDQYLTPEQATWARQLHYRTPLYEPTTRPFIGYQRGDPKENDAFFTTVLRFGWRINGDNSPNSRARRQMRCPKYF
ncbi:MAG: hypothetical protein B7Z54_08250 [Sphingobacteriales bacterium 12-47-4]|nr:MAG: hypothetical protein B7Z54_08250 [Sphingobacteriales bacterium 12-47-4]